MVSLRSASLKLAVPKLASLRSALSRMATVRTALLRLASNRSVLGEIAVVCLVVRIHSKQAEGPVIRLALFPSFFQ